MASVMFSSFKPPEPPLHPHQGRTNVLEKHPTVGLFNRQVIRFTRHTLLLFIGCLMYLIRSRIQTLTVLALSSAPRRTVPYACVASSLPPCYHFECNSVLYPYPPGECVVVLSSNGHHPLRGSFLLMFPFVYCGR